MSIARFSKLGAIGLAVILILSTALTAYNVEQIRVGGPLYEKDRGYSDLYADIHPPSLYLVEAFALANVMVVHPETLDENEAKLLEIKTKWEEAVSRWTEADVNGGIRADIAEGARTDGIEFWDVVENVLEPAAHSGDAEQVEAALDRILVVYNNHRQSIDALNAATLARQQEVAEESETTVWLNTMSSLLVGVLTVAALVGAYFVMARKLLVPMTETSETMELLASGHLDAGRQDEHRDDEIGAMTRSIESFRASLYANRDSAEEQKQVVDSLSDALQKLADGDLSYQIDKPMPGEHDKLRAIYNESVHRLSSMIRDVRASSGSVSQGSDEIRAASDDLATRNEQQAASLEEAAASMSQVTELVRKSADNAQNAQNSMISTHQQASDGGAVVKRAVEAMASIETSSSEITQIIDVIDGIAFQTNLLALNAGVEAARAGDAGKGFAVVANEVRALAQRSAEAARDIKQLISTSTSHVGEGVALVGETGTLLEAIVEQIGAVTAEVDDIASMASAQASNLEQVNSSVSSMDQMTQRNAAMVEETTAAARTLSEEATRLERMVTQFRTDDVPGSALQTPPKSGEISAPPAAVPIRPSAKEPTVPKAKGEPTAVSTQSRAPATAGNLALKDQPEAEFDDQDWSEF
ncbi:MAG: methyl-accepting chemotaxis protein [Pseudomonadota bacterium]